MADELDRREWPRPNLRPSTLYKCYCDVQAYIMIGPGWCLGPTHPQKTIVTMSLLDQLTDRQKDVYEFIRDKIRNRGYGPTVREIGEQFDISSPNGVMCHLKALEKKGLITREPNMSRAIQLAAEPIEERGCRWPGASPPACCTRRSSRTSGSTSRPCSARTRTCSCCKVTGDSMIEAQIADGDYVVVRKQRTARDGQIVVAQTDEGEATLKRSILEKNRIRLEPANSTMKPIYVKNAKVLGVVVGVVRKVD